MHRLRRHAVPLGVETRHHEQRTVRARAGRSRRMGSTRWWPRRRARPNRVTEGRDSANPATVPTITRTNTAAIAVGMTGTRLVDTRACSTASTSRTHSHAFTTPATTATGTRHHDGRVARRLPNTVMATNGEHDDAGDAPRKRATPPAPGDRATRDQHREHEDDGHRHEEQPRQRDDREREDEPHPGSQQQARPPRRRSRSDGRVTATGSSAMSCGHAARTRTVSSALRTARPPSSSAAKPNQLSWYTTIHRRSWNRSNGGGAEPCVASATLDAGRNSSDQERLGHRDRDARRQ